MGGAEILDPDRQVASPCRPQGSGGKGTKLCWHKSSRFCGNGWPLDVEVGKEGDSITTSRIVYACISCALVRSTTLEAGDVMPSGAAECTEESCQAFPRGQDGEYGSTAWPVADIQGIRSIR